MSQYNRKDHFYQKAKADGYPARSAYKLIELDSKFHILKSSHRIVDLGCAPGGWLKVAEEKLKSGRLIGIDLLPLKFQPKPATHFIQGNFLDDANQKKIIAWLGGLADWVISDMSPNLSGISFKDTRSSTELCSAAFAFAKKILKKGGGLVVKIFPGVEMALFQKELKTSFNSVSTFIPNATRKTSDEVYLVARGYS